jgi:uroporphyrin-III C-methyltransferase/precorrin-2 dehydrogenase/sirohydrochlorin ferrochelatase
VAGPRNLEEQQLDDVFLVIAATDDDALNQRVSAAANAVTGW